MKSQGELEEGLYFVHGYYTQENNNLDTNEISREQMLLMKDSIDNVYGIETYEVNTREMLPEGELPQGEFAFFDGRRIYTVENDPTAIMYTELNKQLATSIGFDSYGNQPEELSGNISDVYSYHVNVGHGNCSLVVFCKNNKWNIWMVDCSVFDFTNKENHCKNLNACMDEIYKNFRINRISKLLITHLHYDHINGIEHLIRQGWIDANTEVWMNVQYPWKQPTYNGILLKLKALGVRFIDPVVGNSTQHIKVLYPTVSFNKKNKAPENNINNASVLYQICLNGKRMLFTGDIETEGWDTVTTCMPNLRKSTYYCISHHGSITGHLRNKCTPAGRLIKTLADCSDTSEIQILMGRNGAYRGVYSGKVLRDFGNIVKTEDATKYIEIEWDTGIVNYI